MTPEYKHSELSELVIKVFYNVYNTLGYGFLERVYANAMLIELRRLGLSAKKEVPLRIYYRDELVGEYFADLIVKDLIIVELKAVHALAEEHEAQLLNYLKATRYEVGLLLNFGPKAQIKRKAYDNENKGNLSWIKA